MLVFVFGTLKEGFPNFGANAGVRVPGIFVTHQRYPFYLVGQRHSPWLINTPDQGEHVFGQVFQVELEALKQMDLLERVSEPDGYERVQIQVTPQSRDPGGLVNVFAYLKPPESLAGEEVMLGPLAEYTLEHAARYRKRAL
jgi:gamma-glutamylaminecyclotransferase